ALEPDPLVLPAVALPVASRSEDLLAEQAVLLRLEGAVVDGLRLLDLAVGPLPDVLGGGQADAQLVEVVDVEHYDFPLSGFGGAKVGRSEGRSGSRTGVPQRKVTAAVPVRPPRRCSARGGTGRCPAPRQPVRRHRRCRASRAS